MVDHSKPDQKEPTDKLSSNYVKVKKIHVKK